MEKQTGKGIKMEDPIFGPKWNLILLNNLKAKYRQPWYSYGPLLYTKTFNFNLNPSCNEPAVNNKK